MKPVVKLKGSLAYKPAVGERMMILQEGSLKYYTSKLVAVHKRWRSVELETQNTIYRITYEKGNRAKKAA